MNVKRQICLYIAFVILLLPNVTFAAWWNPLSWSIWDTWFGEDGSEIVDATVDLDTSNHGTEQNDLTTKLDFSAFETYQATDSDDTGNTKHPSDYDQAYVKSQSSGHENSDGDNRNGGFFTGTLGGVAQTPAQEQPQTSTTQTQTQPTIQTQNTESYAHLTDEQRAIKMATDVAYPDSPLHVTVRQEIDANWIEILKYYKGGRGKDSVDAMFQDLMEAYIAWKTPPSLRTESKSALATFTECMEKVTRISEQRQKERQRCMDNNAGDSIAQYSCPTVNTSSLYSACGVKPSTSTNNTNPSGSITSDQHLNTDTLSKSSNSQLTIYGQANTYTKIGNTWYGDDGSSFTQIGSSIYAGDGTSYNQIGNTVYGSDSSSYMKIGNTTYRNDGTSYTKIGNTTYASDGTAATQVGNTTYITQ